MEETLGPQAGGKQDSTCVCVCVGGYLHIDKSQFNIELFQQPDGFNLPVNVCVCVCSHTCGGGVRGTQEKVPHSFDHRAFN